MKEQLWESIKLMLWAWTMGRGETLPEGFREVLDKVEELLEEAAEGEKTQAGAADAPLYRALAALRTLRQQGIKPAMCRGRGRWKSA